ncbi:unnamed protein product [Cuscuta epithymum]|uniref:SLH domain-containing protein n=1 Tax=Cuscuta epithymum TaxID=186058 RepID=A0AAV0D1N7_9ASTE|nr:unnamed protein product [Cuscuta epithymum]
MGSLTATLSPNSFQLRLALNCRKPSTLLVRVCVGKKDYNHRLHLLFLGENHHARNRNGLERRNFLVNSVTPEAEFGGWSEADEAERSIEAQEKQPIGGLLQAGVAGVVLVAGIVFATLSISKLCKPRLKQCMDPLTTQQETSVISDNHNDRVESKNDILNNKMQGSDNQETNADIYNDPLLHPENHDGNSPAKHGSHNQIVSDDNSSASPDVGVSDSFRHSSFGSKDISFAGRDPGSVNEQYGPFGANFDDTNAIHVPHTSSLTNPSMDKQEGVSDLDEPVNSQSASTVESMVENVNIQNMVEVPAEGDNLNSEARGSSGKVLEVTVMNQYSKELKENIYNDNKASGLSYNSSIYEEIFPSAGIPAPSSVSAALQTLPGKVLVPAVIDQIHGQALAALQVLKVIEDDVRPSDLCTRREYARWLVASSCALSRSTVSKIYPAMYIENVTELAFDDVTIEDPDFPCIQGLAEAGLISSKLSRRDTQSSADGDQSPLFFSPDSPLSRQDLLSWKMALEKRLLPLVDQKTLKQLSGFIDIEKIHPDAWPAVAADLASGEQGIIALAFGYTRLFQPDKPVTKAQAAIALATGEAHDIVAEELARIDADYMAEEAVTAQKALIAEAEKEVNAIYEKELSLEREKNDAVQKMAEDVRQELERIQAEWEEENLSLLKERAAIDSEMEVFSRLRSEVQEQLHTLKTNNLEISYDKERLKKLREDADLESQAISRLQYELEVERKALSMARAWAEDEAKRARDQANALKVARDRWEKHGIKVVVDDDLQEEANTTPAIWPSAGEQLSIEGTVSRAENLEDRLRGMADSARGKSRDTIHRIMEKIHLYISIARELAQRGLREAVMVKDNATKKICISLHSVEHKAAGFGEGVKRFAGDCKEGVEKISHRFKT